jgi:hypothetical protein
MVEYLDGVRARVKELKWLQAAPAAELEQLGKVVQARVFQRGL